MCKYKDGKYKSTIAVIRSLDSCDNIDDSNRCAVILGRRVKEFDNGSLDDSSLTKTRTKVGKYDNIDKLLIEYVDRLE